jgi:hypothetical protein
MRGDDRACSLTLNACTRSRVPDDNSTTTLRGLFGETQERKPEHIERDTMVGLGRERGMNRESVDERDHDVGEER